MRGKKAKQIRSLAYPPEFARRGSLWYAWDKVRGCIVSDGRRRMYKRIKALAKSNAEALSWLTKMRRGS